MALKPASNRNRHTGRINAAKARVIKNGEFVQAKDGARYARWNENPHKLGMTYVRLF